MTKINHHYIDLGNGKIETLCRQCGYEYETWGRYMLPDRNTKWYLCKSCNYQPSEIVRYGKDWCLAWQGDFDLEWLLCLDDDGKPVKVGPRSCGHWDCVRKEHLIA